MKKAKTSLAELSVRPSKQRGQNFLIDPFALSSIVDFGSVGFGSVGSGSASKATKLVEIGPGLGALTEQLLKTNLPLTVIELEQNFCRSLAQKYPKLQIINQDVREFDFSTLGEDLTVFGNLPYSFSSEIIFHILKFKENISRAVFLLQKEFVERLAASPGTKIYGSLSVAVQIWCDVRTGPVIHGDCFHPPTKVESQVVELSFLKSSRYPISDFKFFELVVRAAFKQRRKKISNSLRGLPNITDEQIEQGLEFAGIDSGQRAETVEMERFVKLAQFLVR